jgi:uncharacterized repeat protein (TIGR03803 family)
MKYGFVVLLAGTAGYACLGPVLGAGALQTGERVVYSFGSNQTDGGIPEGRLLNIGGIFYGTTLQGGNNPQGGTAFVLDPSTGAEQVLYSFCSGPRCSDGGQPRAGLIEVGGLLYGTTNIGGAADKGAVISIDPISGIENVLYSFCSQQNCADGQAPEGELFAENGVLYGTTDVGGAYGLGVVYSIDPGTGAEQTLHSFSGGGDGSYPRGAMIDVNGTLYGTTSEGGANNGGTIYALNLGSGAEWAPYAFCSQQNCADGQYPLAGLVALNGTLYGTTYAGGANGGGTVFAYDRRTHAERTLYAFCSQQNCTDGEEPYAGLTKFRGILYGTTQYGGSSGKGTLFSIDPATGAENQIYSFCSQQNCTDGAYPAARLIHAKDRLFGTTSEGGTSTFCQGGCGTVFAIWP